MGCSPRHFGFDETLEPVPSQTVTPPGQILWTLGCGPPSPPECLVGRRSVASRVASRMEKVEAGSLAAATDLRHNKKSCNARRERRQICIGDSFHVPKMRNLRKESRVW